MSESIDAIAMQKAKAIQYMIAQIMDESNQKGLLPSQTVELAIQRGMEYQKKLDNPEPKDDKEWMYAQRNNNELGADYFQYQGYHPR